MSVGTRIAVASVLGLTVSVAHADHHHGMEMDGEPHESFGAGVQLVAASYSTVAYVGDYEGVTPSVSWGSSRFTVGAAIGVYRLEENGLERFGPGDFAVHGQATAIDHGPVRAGVAVMLTAPTGEAVAGLGMGHPMAMTALWGNYRVDRVTFAASGGFNRALVFGDMSSHHDHGMWPIVEPMNMSELTWSAGGDVAIGSGVHGGASINGGVPVGAPGHDRIAAGGRVAWGSSRVETAVELQVGLVGDPFVLRGVVETALHF